MKRIAIMQPYFLPYIGYFQLMSAVDEFVIYDRIKYTKKGWINRNRFLLNGKDEYFSLPLKKDADTLNINERYLADNFIKENEKSLRRIEQAYRAAKYYQEIKPILYKCFLFKDRNLFNFIYNSISVISDYLEISTKITRSSHIENNSNLLKGTLRVINICKLCNADIYINPIGGLSLYKKNEFMENGINIKFLKTNDFIYQQANDLFTPFLSIIDVLFFNGKTKTIQLLNEHKYIE